MKIVWVQGRVASTTLCPIKLEENVVLNKFIDKNMYCHYTEIGGYI